MKDATENLLNFCRMGETKSFQYGLVFQGKAYKFWNFAFAKLVLAKWRFCTRQNVLRRQIE